MNYADIKTIDIQDGTGVRVSIYVSGCHFHCKGCHNSEAWDFNYGKKFDNSTIKYIMELLDREYISGLSILGGEPLELVNQQGLLPLVKEIKQKYPNKTIWCYTGYDFEKDVLGNMYKKYSYTKDFLENIDIIVDGQFIEEKKIVDLKFRGSTNQKKIDVQKSLKEGSVVQLKFGDESRYENSGKTLKSKELVYKEFKFEEDSAQKEEKVEDENIEFIPNVINIKPAFEIKEVEQKNVAEGINNKI